MGDAPPHDPEPVTGYTEAEVLDAAKGVTIDDRLPSIATPVEPLETTAGSPTVIHAILIGKNSAARESFTHLADGTRGRLFEAATAAEVVDTILDAIDVIDPLPPPPTDASCTDLFGDAPDFMLCQETTTFCSFNTTTGGGTCDEMCGGFGSQCVDALDNSERCIAIAGTNDSCQTPRQEGICVCERSDATTPPPPPPPPPSDASCTELFGGAPEFILCGETADTCSFNVRTNGGTCNQICAGFGTACVGAISNDASCEGNPDSTDTCETVRPVDEICICERPETP